ncbi:hypothetical protein G3580_01575 [Nitrogeniibacter mangrovi]|uniref:Uncharacterized protein n=1 Tax=Nitrogeniibacter mangrovi TaxID=2016596 RepID=A0A6C1B253_9RHOO|nr:hypothetical protein [Nitrogeniibacter mangrovi]QID16430.1 hypothetical protein G3580_01575 [Nitrogeniibacter mangrovi]
MNTQSFKIKQVALAIGATTFLVLASPWVADLPVVGGLSVVGSAHAETHGGEGKGPRGGESMGKQGADHEAGGASKTTESVLSDEEEGDEGHKGHDGGPQHEIDKQKGAPNPGDHGDAEDGDGKGPRAGSAGATGGGKPSWAQEGIPEVELGRLNVARSPGHVLDQALLEALKTLSATSSLYANSTLQDLLVALDAAPTRVDSPLENLALYKDLLADGVITDAPEGITSNTELLAALFLASASDKTVPISEDTVTAINTILGVSLPEGVDLSTFAETADTIREKIYEVHER